MFKKLKKIYKDKLIYKESYKVIKMTLLRFILEKIIDLNLEKK